MRPICMICRNHQHRHHHHHHHHHRRRTPSSFRVDRISGLMITMTSSCITDKWICVDIKADYYFRQRLGTCDLMIFVHSLAAYNGYKEKLIELPLFDSMSNVANDDSDDDDDDDDEDNDDDVTKPKLILYTYNCVELMKMLGKHCKVEERTKEIPASQLYVLPRRCEPIFARSSRSRYPVLHTTFTCWPSVCNTHSTI
uniref:Uncharacterized protein n=1 Tax=Glossina austeni TaxID=7395 RepID=A0A1A9VKU1_GLOAU